MHDKTTIYLILNAFKKQKPPQNNFGAAFLYSQFSKFVLFFYKFRIHHFTVFANSFNKINSVIPVGNVYQFSIPI